MDRYCWWSRHGAFLRSLDDRSPEPETPPQHRKAVELKTGPVSFRRSGVGLTTANIIHDERLFVPR